MPQYSWIFVGSDSPAAVKKPIAGNQNICDYEYLQGTCMANMLKSVNKQLGVTTWFVEFASNSKGK